MDRYSSFFHASRSDEKEKFERSRETYFERSVLALPGGRPGRSPGVQKLIPHVLRELELKGKFEERYVWFQCFCVAVAKGDGMTWAAEKLNAEIADKFPQYERVCLPDLRLTDALPVVADLVRRRTFLKLAARHHLGQRFLSLQWWVSLAILGAAVAFSTAYELLKSQLESNPQSLTYVTFGALSALGLAAQHIVGYWTVNSDSSGVRDLIRLLQEQGGKKGGEAADNYQGFVNELALHLQPKERPRVVIVDNYEHLDATTRAVIRRYFETHTREKARASEMWVIFEGTDGETFSKEATKFPPPPAFKETSFFKQLLLTDPEKRAFVERLGLPDYDISFSTIKNLVRQHVEDEQHILIKIENERAKLGKSDSYGPFEFLYFLSLNDSPHPLFISRKALASEPIQQRPVRRKVLPLLLPGGQLKKTEFQANLNDVEKHFAEFLETEEANSQKQLRVRSDVARVLAENHVKLGLPPPELGHLFWALYWYDKLQNHVIEAFWMRKLAHHLMQADVLEVSAERLQKEVAPNLFDALLFTTSGYLKTCLFERQRAGGRRAADVPSLLEKAAGLLESDLLRGKTSAPRDLLDACWEAYSVLGDDEILRVMLEVYPLIERGPREAEREEAAERGAFEQLFFDSLRLPPSRRAALEASFFRRVVSRGRAGASIADYARARSTWLALTLAPMASTAILPMLDRAAFDGREQLGQLLDSALERCESAPGGAVHLKDIVTLSLSVWGLALDWEMAGLLESGLPPEILNSAPVADAMLMMREAAFASVLEKAEKVARAVERMMAGATAGRDERGMDFLKEGLARELHAVTLAAVVTAAHRLDQHWELSLSDELLGRADRLAETVGARARHRLPRFSDPAALTAPETVKKVDELLDFCGIIWHRFGLHRMRDYVQIRRVHFNSLCRRWQETDTDVKKLLDSVGSAAYEEDFTGLMASAVIADCLGGAGELKSVYLRQAGQVALAEDFGRGLKRELSLLAIAGSHTYDCDLSPFVEGLLSPNGGGRSYLDEYLASLPEKQVVRCVLRFSNTSERVAAPELAGRLEQTLSDFVLRVGDERVRREAESLIEAQQLKRRARNGEKLDAASLVREWQDRKDLWLYPHILDLALEYDPSNKQLMDEGVAILKRNARNFSHSTYLYLALRLLSNEHIRPNGPWRVPFDYLKAAIGGWERTLSAGLNIVVFQLLRDLSAKPEEREFYNLKLARWSVNEARAALLRNLPEMLRQGRFFLVFREQVRLMLRWGLKTDPPYREGLNEPPPPDAQRAAHALLQRGAPLPPPFAGEAVNGHFLSLGSYLFDPPNDQNADFADARALLNEAASEALLPLTDLIAKLPELPAPIRELLQTYIRFMSPIHYTPTKDEW